jgi:hypothetical protein
MKTLPIALAATLIAGAGAGTVAAQNISQNQSGSGNSQSLSIGNVDGKPAKKQKKGKKQVDSTQSDPDTGNTQSVKADGGGNVAQNQSGRGNKQSIDIGPGVGGSPSVTQTQTGANKKQSIVVDGKKVEKKQE